MTIRTLKDITNNPIPGVYTMVSSFNRIVYRVWYKGEWYPEVFTSAKNAEIQFEGLKERTRNKVIEFTLLAILVLMIVLATIVTVRYW